MGDLQWDLPRGDFLYSELENHQQNLTMFDTSKYWSIDAPSLLFECFSK
jgi:hypothetical protein